MEYLHSRLPGVSFRRSRLYDAASLHQWRDSLQAGGNGVLFYGAFSERPESELDVFVDLIQTSYLCVTAVSSAQESLLVGFLALGTGPHPGLASSLNVAQRVASPVDSLFKAKGSLAPLGEPRWEDLLRSPAYVPVDEDTDQNMSLESIRPYNTLWLNMLIAPPSSSHSKAIPSQCFNDRATLSRNTHPVFLCKPEGETLQNTSKQSQEKVCGISKLVYSSMELTRELLAVALGAMQGIEYLLCPFPSNSLSPKGKEGHFFSHLRDLGVLFAPSPRCRLGSGMPPPVFAQRDKILLLLRQRILPRLTIRHGCQEDYDDFVPLLLNGVGVHIRLPDEFYLEELLKDQDDTHKVLVAENPLTYEVVGFACTHVISLTEHHTLSKSYQMGTYDTLFDKKGFSGVQLAKALPETPARQMVQIDFLYWDPDYEGSSWDLLRGLFRAFPACTDAFIVLPHHTRESGLLKSFHYIPIRPYEPYVSREDAVPMPEGLWVCSRDSLSQGCVGLLWTEEEAAEVENELLRTQPYDMSYDEAARLSEDLRRAGELKVLSPSQLGSTASSNGDPAKKECLEHGGVVVFTLSRIASEWQSSTPTELVGVASLCPITVKGLHALRANYNIDNYVYFYARRGRDYSATDIHASLHASMSSSCAEKFSPNEVRDLGMSAVLIRGMYVKPIYRGWIRFFVREMLRWCGADIAVLFPVRGQGQSFFPLVRELLPCQPRRVVEYAVVEDATEGASPTIDPTALASLFIATPRYLGDEKVRLHARLVVVGASATALGFFHRLLSIPYMRFGNLVLISTDGFPLHANQARAGARADGLGNQHRAAWLADSMELLEREHHFLTGSQSIRVVAGRLVDIDKANCCVAVDNAVFEPYDYLILATGRQYVVPPRIHQLLQQEGRGVPEKCIIPLIDDAAFHRAREALEQLSQNANGVPNVLVYGSSLDAYAVGTAIVQREGFSPQRVVLCSRERRPSHMDETSLQAALTVLRSLGVSVFQGFDLGRMEFNEEGGLTSVVLEPTAAAAGSPVELNCGLILCVEDKDIDPRILCALNKRSIVLDGRIIVDKDYLTTDPHILAAGPVAMWTRRYGVTPNFEDFNARDVGYDLACKLLVKLGFTEFSIAFLSRHNGLDPTRPLDEVSSVGTVEDATVLPIFQRDTGAEAETTGWVSNRDKASGTSAMRSPPARRGPDRTVFSTPRARRVVFPFGFEFFSVECVAFEETACEVLSCSNICSLSEMRDRLLRDLDSSIPSHTNIGVGDKGSTEEKGGNAVGKDKYAAGAPVSGSQNVLSIYVNQINHTIDAVRYFGDDRPELYNYMALIGYPELLLNLTFRYKEAAERSRQTAEANLPPTCCLTAGVLNHQLDLINYLRLPYFRTIFSDRFVTFFAALRRRMRQHEEFVRVEEQILAKRVSKETFVPLTEEEANTHMKTLSDTKRAFRQEIELALVRFLHENKEFRPNITYLPNIRHLVDKNEPIVSLM